MGYINVSWGSLGRDFSSLSLSFPKWEMKDPALWGSSVEKPHKERELMGQRGVWGPFCGTTCRAVGFRWEDALTSDDRSAKRPGEPSEETPLESGHLNARRDLKKNVSVGEVQMRGGGQYLQKIQSGNKGGKAEKKKRVSVPEALTDASHTDRETWVSGLSCPEFKG